MPLTVDVSAAQAPDGIQLTALEVDDVEVDSVGAAPCDGTTCPARARETLTYDPTFDADGTYEYRVNTVDGDDERTNGPLWTIAIDRTAPRPPSDPWFIGLDPDDPTTGSVLFESGRDPKARGRHRRLRRREQPGPLQSRRRQLERLARLRAR